MSKPIGSGYSDRDYEARKKARDKMERDLRDAGVSSDKAREKANQIARETDNKRRSEGQE